MTTYEQSITEIHEAIRTTTAKVAAGVLPQTLLDSYVAAARQRTDWVDPS